MLLICVCVSHTSWGPNHEILYANLSSTVCQLCLTGFLSTQGRGAAQAVAPHDNAAAAAAAAVLPPPAAAAAAAVLPPPAAAAAAVGMGRGGTGRGGTRRGGGGTRRGGGGAGRGGQEYPTGLAAVLQHQNRQILAQQDDNNNNHTHRFRGINRTPRNIDQVDILDQMQSQVNGNILAVQSLANSFRPAEPREPSEREKLETVLSNALSRRRQIHETGGDTFDEDVFIRNIRGRLNAAFEKEFPSAPGAS